MKRIIPTLALLTLTTVGCGALDSYVDSRAQRVHFQQTVDDKKLEREFKSIERAYDKIDIRRSIKLEKAVKGAEIVDALKKMASRDESMEYVQLTLLERDGIKVYKVGLSHFMPYADVVIRTGEGLNNFEIELEKSYQNFGVGSIKWGEDAPPDQGKAPIGYGYGAAANEVKAIAGALEELLH